MRTVLVTGSAGFIGSHVAQRLLDDGWRVVGIDNVNAYYDPALKEARLARLRASNHFHEEQVSVEDREAVTAVFRRHAPERIIHLAAQAGVRHSLDAPQDYVDANITGFLNILEAARAHPVDHLVFASTSSVFGLDKAMPLSPHRGGNHPVSFYAATKKANEMMAHAYAHLFAIPCTGLRFFTVYGPWGRPDMALFKFTKAILAGEPVPLYNEGRMVRDFTYIDDIVEGVVRIADRPAAPDPAWEAERPDPASSAAPYRIYNIGNSQPVELLTYLEAIEAATGRTARRELLPMQPGDVSATWADVEDLVAATGFRPSTPVADGVRAFVDWYRDYYGV
ncbi:NAD-dependent epimerase [Polymorphum gilvum]|uniref:NAD-dependent epimerase/dehydratase:Short-chain dehydrogenase/reductase SDR n=1 Tax=Polymorphum gilvum (strain LMG 25793 / CGMCC 1.9160 / SL003B-26A1) TaxID=991905 RepID=F2IVR8_POLGS|nr:NAD-dependent epimerase [Polymorphum gilvum]ADZ69175.1 NAD-dependent epimerase/dehydratase:Short-chain dehydrogenase/reductase SDR [Polymorphum gilvum SL003B-26A1]